MLPTTFHSLPLSPQSPWPQTTLLSNLPTFMEKSAVLLGNLNLFLTMVKTSPALHTDSLISNLSTPSSTSSSALTATQPPYTTSPHCTAAMVTFLVKPVSIVSSSALNNHKAASPALRPKLKAQPNHLSKEPLDPPNSSPVLSNTNTNTNTT